MTNPTDSPTAAKAREQQLEARFKTFILDSFKWQDFHCEMNGLRNMSAVDQAKIVAPWAAAFAESELAATEKRVREECAKAVCHHCRDSSHSEKYITKAKQVEGKWIHEEIGFEHERGGFDCYAASIRSLELKGE